MLCGQRTVRLLLPGRPGRRAPVHPGIRSPAEPGCRGLRGLEGSDGRRPVGRLSWRKRGTRCVSPGGGTPSRGPPRGAAAGCVPHTGLLSPHTEPFSLYIERRLRAGPTPCSPRGLYSRDSGR